MSGTKPQGPEADWSELIGLTKDVGAIRMLERAEETLLRHSVHPEDRVKAVRMLRICMLKKCQLEARIAELVDGVIAAPYWDDKIPGDPS